MREGRAHPDQWLRDVTPSADVRHWHHHDQDRFAEPGDRCIGEPEDADHRPAVQHLRDLAAHDRVTSPRTSTPGRPPYSPAGSAPPAQRAARSVLRHPADLAD
ncbi:hypothetical protein ACWDFR_15965 [Streptomyces sp. 900105755]